MHDNKFIQHCQNKQTIKVLRIEMDKCNWKERFEACMYSKMHSNGGRAGRQKVYVDGSCWFCRSSTVAMAIVYALLRAAYVSARSVTLFPLARSGLL